MSTSRFIGIAILIVGVIFLALGINASHSFSDQISESVSGRYTDHTMLYIIGGIILILGGGGLAFRRYKR